MTSTVVQWNAQLVKDNKGKCLNKVSFDNQKRKKHQLCACIEQRPCVTIRRQTSASQEETREAKSPSSFFLFFGCAQGSNPGPAVKALSPNNWIAREFPMCLVLCSSFLSYDAVTPQNTGGVVSRSPQGYQKPQMFKSFLLSDIV